MILINPGIIIAAVVAGVAVLGTAGSFAGANKLFNKVIPRQDGVKVDLDEMADMQKWEEYKKIITPNREWFQSAGPEHVTVKSKDGLTLHGDFLPAEKESDRLVICFHGYTSSRLSNCSFAAFMHGLGYDCLLVDNRAHGDSEGEYIGFGILDRYDCLEWINYVNKRFDSKKKIVLYGVSMGASTAVMAAGMKELPENVSAVISDCAFTSPFDVFSHILKRDYKLSQFPVMNINDAICRKKAGYGFRDYSTLEAVKSTKCPILLIHGKDDDFVPLWMTQKNFEECSAPKDILIVENAGHGASYYEDSEKYREKATEFLNKYIK